MVKKVKNLKSRSEFARECKVSAAAVTKACNNALKEALSGKRIDAGHEDAIEYKEKQLRSKTPEMAPGIDSLYEKVVEWCHTTKKYKGGAIRAEFHIGAERASKIIETMQTAGIIPDKSDQSEAQQEGGIGNYHVRGHVARNEDKKAAATGNDTVTLVAEHIWKFADMSLRDLVKTFGTDIAFTDWLKAAKAIEEIEGKRLANASLKGTLVNRELVKTGVLDQVDATFRRLLIDGKQTITKRIIELSLAGKSVGECEAFFESQISSFIRPMKTMTERVLRDA